jgi:hypothetical protein
VTGILTGGLTEGSRGWSLAALLAGVFGAGCAAILLASQSDPSTLNWPLILVPAVVVPLPLLLPRVAVRRAAAAVMCVWCLLAAASLGLFFVPCLMLMIGAARGVDE